MATVGNIIKKVVTPTNNVFTSCYTKQRVKFISKKEEGELHNSTAFFSEWYMYYYLYVY